MAVDVDVVVVGSGPSGVHAAFRLVEAGLTVRMLDVGYSDTVYSELVPAAPFEEIRRTDPEQSRYLLGDQFEGIAFGRTGPGAQLTPARRHVVYRSSELQPTTVSDFTPMTSLALGGLGAAWGTGAVPFTDPDLAGFPISRADLEPHYEAVARRIGISGDNDDLAPVFGDLRGLLPALTPDLNGASLFERYRHKRHELNAAGFRLGQPWLALLSRDLGSRRRTAYRDMDFWTDRDRSAYRPRWTLEELSRHQNFRYLAHRMVKTFDESTGQVAVRVENLETGSHELHTARALVLAAGTLGTARIVLRSLKLYQDPVPLVCNPHVYIACLNRHLLGRQVPGRRHSMAQLCFAYTANGTDHPATVGHLYSYRSLLTFRLAKETPLTIRDGLSIFRLLHSALALLIVQHEDHPSPEKRMRLVRDPAGGRDRLAIDYSLSKAEKKRNASNERAIIRCFRKLGCIALRRVRPGSASSVHYAGSFPMTAVDRPLTTDLTGRLRPSKAVYLADGSTFPYLPSKGLTFSLMANADRIGASLATALSTGT
jgi:choline dehydrogenase-like flavoprotein